MSIKDKRKNYKPFRYPWAYDLMKEQQKAHWLPEEIGDLGRDLAQFYSTCTPAEQHGITTLLKVFTTVELEGAECYWAGRVWHEFPHPEIQGMATTFASMEHVHAEAYDKLNTALGLDSEEFYLSFFDDPSYKERVAYIEDSLGSTDIMTSLLTFALIEGVCLFGQFAYLQSFSNAGLFKQVDNLVAWSSRDEGALHLMGTVGLLKELEKEGQVLCEKMWDKAVAAILDQENTILDEMFKHGDPRTITKDQLRYFILHRVNVVGDLLGMPGPVIDGDVVVKDWFYKEQQLQVSSDFFDSRVTEYSKGYDFSGVWE